jgi:hypothetical protein
MIPAVKSHLEYPWYDVWALVLWTLFRLSQRVTIAPQFRIRTAEDRENFDNYSVIPDFAALDTWDTTNKAGPWIADPNVQRTPILLVENKPLAPKKMSIFSERWKGLWTEAEFQLESQARAAWSRYHLTFLLGIVAVGDIWACHQWQREPGDLTFKPLPKKPAHTKDDDDYELDSGDDYGSGAAIARPTWRKSKLRTKRRTTTHHLNCSAERI